MEVKKDIGKAFREKLDSLDRQPGDALWDSISKDLDTKKKRKFPFFWLYIFSSSVVAVMLATYILTNIAGTDNDAAGTKPDGMQRGVVTNNSSSSASTENHPGDRKNSNDSSSNTSANQNTTDGITLTDTERSNTPVENSGNTNSSNTNNSSTKNSSAKNGSVKHTTTGGVANGTGVASKNKTNNATGQAADGTAATSKNSGLKNNTATAAKQQQHKHYTTRTNNGSNSVTAKSGNTKKNYPASSYTANNQAASASAGKENSGTANNSIINSSTGTTSANRVIADRNNKKSTTNASGTTAQKQNNSVPDSNGTTVSGSTTNEIGTKGIGTAFAHDSLPESIVAKDSLKPEVPKEEVAEEKKEENKKDSIAPKPFKKFSVFAYGGPSNFSFPNRAIVTDSTTSNINTSNTARYGVLFGYRLNNKLSIRTGFSLFNLKQSAITVKLNYYMETTPVGGAQIMPPPDFTWIDYNNPPGWNNGAVIDRLGDSYSAIINIDRELSYVEIPLEISYDLFDKRFGITLTGGGSMLIQTKNEVFAYNENGRMYLGKWNAAAKTSFTGTLGLGLHYKFTPSLQLNAEPVFNYYFNTFKDSKPTSFTVRVGLQYNFDF